MKQLVYYVFYVISRTVLFVVNKKVPKYNVQENF